MDVWASFHGISASATATASAMGTVAPTTGRSVRRLLLSRVVGVSNLLRHGAGGKRLRTHRVEGVSRVAT